jgi:hypothetical protein
VSNATPTPAALFSFFSVTFVVRAHDGYPSSVKVTTRIDGREQGGWHVDRSDCGLWESILPGGQTPPVTPTRVAARIARAYLRACKEQGARRPKMPAPCGVALAA